MFSHSGHVMTLANSIIGVGILAMPFCFQKCGIVLSILLLVLNNFITRISCHYLIKSSLLTRRKSFEFLAFHSFGPSGKLLVELCVIGYLLGTCITYFVVVGDLGPQIVSKIFDMTVTDNLRLCVMVAVTFLCIIPLGMLKNVDSLSTVCTASIGFYICLVVKVIAESQTHILSNDWEDKIVYWRPAGVLQCLPIFSMALSCQMQIFEVFDSITNQSMDKLNGIVKSAAWICTLVYIAVGVFGYIAFCTETFSGNILINFAPTFGSDVIKIGFVLSVAFSFPLVIFPCRASIYSLIYRRGHTDASSFIPENRFKAITVFIVILALCVALLIPSIELVIGLVGSTIGVAICIIFPAACIRQIIKKESAERTLAQLIIIGGICLMILGTYANLDAIDEKRSGAVVEIQGIPPQLSVNDFKPDLKPEIIESPVKESKLEKYETPPVKVLNPEKVESIQKDLKPEKVDSVQKDFKLEKVESPVKTVNNLTIPTDIHRNDTIQNVVKEEVVLPSIKPKINTVPIGNVIDKDAIKKDEEIAAEEHKDTPKSDNLQNAENELKKTKDYFRKEVNELKEQLAKQNEETQHLVAEKLEQVVEKVEQIEREVHQKGGGGKLKTEEIGNEVDHRKEVKGELSKDIVEDKGYKSNDKIREDEKEKEKIVDKKDELSQIKSNPIEIPKDSIMGILTENLKNSSKLTKDAQINDKKTNGTVYEPMSYKTGELIEKVKEVKNITMDNRGPLPLALLINASQIKEPEVKPPKELNPLEVKIQKSVEEHIKLNKSNKNAEKENKDTIRRDILQVKNTQLGVTTEKENLIREKRDVENIEENCDTKDEKSGQANRRDLKSIK